MLLPQVTKLAKLLLVLPATSATSERSFSAMKSIKTYLRSTTSRNRLNHCMLLHVHCKKNDQLNMIEITKETIKEDCRHLACFENIKSSPRITTIYSKRKQKDKFSMFNVSSYKSNMRQYFCQ